MDLERRSSRTDEQLLSVQESLLGLVPVASSSAARAFPIEPSVILEVVARQKIIKSVTTMPRLGDYAEITRPRIVAIVVMTAATGYLLTASRFALPKFLLFILGLTLISAAANAFNQILERKFDAQMNRTRCRPLPTGKLPVRNALLFACAICAVGMAILGLEGFATAFFGALALVSYDLIYTPLKRSTSISLYVGAIPGALPALIGNVAARGHVTTVGLVLFAVVFLWQMPHFVAIGWLYREDYARAGFRILSVEDFSGAKSGITGLVCSVALLPTLLLATSLHAFGSISTVISVVFALGFIFYAVQFYSVRTAANARRLFVASNCFLMVMTIAASVDGILRIVRLKS
jgi:protoheme IX farnesyltransferase